MDSSTVKTFSNGGTETDSIFQTLYQYTSQSFGWFLIQWFWLVIGGKTIMNRCWWKWLDTLQFRMVTHWQHKTTNDVQYILNSNKNETQKPLEQRKWCQHSLFSIKITLGGESNSYLMKHNLSAIMPRVPVYTSWQWTDRQTSKMLWVICFSISAKWGSDYPNRHKLGHY